ncbi:MAG: biopolymer transporter ExbD [Phycisphaerae bacterium]|nr:biopolymer transporter ExbD [Phycisphaerae bacterium]
MSFAQPKRELRRASVPLAPMLDIMFLLLIFFVTTSSFRAEERLTEVPVPEAESGKPATATRTQLIVNVRSDGSILVGPVQYSMPQLDRLLRQLVRDFPDERVIIRGDRRSSYESIMQVMDTAALAGIKKIFFATVKKQTGSGS